jgi:tRNA nucleotidyltransferase/poly(A) polymerase
MTRFFKVGGAVRDELMGVRPKDIDFAVECESFDKMREAILARGGKIFVETPKFFTIRAMMPEPFGAADFVLCRKDGEYKDGRRPESVSVGTIHDDLARRDFTINAMAIDCETGEVIDNRGMGRADIACKQIRCVGEPLARFNEDALRIFRAVRFAITKKFGIESETCLAMRRFNAKDFAGVSTERIREELLKCFAFDTFRTIDRIRDDFPELAWVMKERGIWLKPTIEKA